MDSHGFVDLPEWVIRDHGTIAGMSFGRLRVLGYVGKGKWSCVCECGKSVIIKRAPLVNGNTRSCGCLGRHLAAKRATKHGMAGEKVYSVWRAIISRCQNPNISGYANYGGRGITVCERWSGKNGFQNFFSDMGLPPSPGMTIDRKDNDGPYSPENCRWATWREQASNSRRAKPITYQGITSSLIEHCERLGINYRRVQMRLHRGWTVEDAFERPSSTGHDASGEFAHLSEVECS